MKNKTNLTLFVITLFALLLRTVYLSENPPALNWDEVSHGFNAYSILKTGRDEWGKLFPITNFRAYGDYPLPLNLYLTIPFIFVFGLSPFAIRLPHAILGALTVTTSFFLVRGITKDKKIALMVSFLVAVDPWTLFTSRFVAQSNVSTFFLTAAMAAFFYREKNKFLLPLSFLLLGLTLFSYHTTRIFSPLLLVAIFIIYRKKIKLNLASSLILVIFFFPLPSILLNPEARARSVEVFLINKGAVNKIIEARQESNLQNVLKRLVFNRPVYFAKEFAKNYIEYFSPEFLFLKGGTQYQFSVPNHGLLYLVNLPFFYIGLFLVIKKTFQKNKDFGLLLFWLLLAPIPASITTEKLAVLRSSAILPLPQILVSLGLVEIYQKFRKKKNIIVIAYLITVVLSVESYLTRYFKDYRKGYSWAWQYGYKEVVQYIKERYDNYDKIIFTKKYGEPHEFLLFYWPWDPERYRKDPYLIRFYQSNWYWVDRFDKFNFINDWDIPKKDSEFILESKETVDCLPAGKAGSTDNCLLITSPDNYPEGWRKLETINFLDSKAAFEIYEN